MYIKITTESSCDLTKELVEQYEICVIPLEIQVGNELKLDGLEVTPENLYDHVEKGGEIPATSAVNPARYAELFSKYSKRYEAVIHISIGSGFSSCYQNACAAAAEFSNVFVVDSCSLSSGQGQMVIEAALLARTSATPQEIVARLTALGAPYPHQLCTGTARLYEKRRKVLRCGGPGRQSPEAETGYRCELR